MPALSIRARFPLGTFLGHREKARRTAFPDVVRLHAALTHAAGNGSTAIVDGDQLRPSPAAIAALCWLEEHPPTALALPNMCPVATNPARSWRVEGASESKKKPDRKTLKAQSDAYAYDGSLGWAWDEDAPAEVIETIRVLCEDVSCLGEAESVVVLEVAEIEPTHLGGGSVTPFTSKQRGDVWVSTPEAGRYDELEATHRASNPVKRPSPAADRHSWSQSPHSVLPPRAMTVERSYRPVAPPPVQAPWPTGIRISVDRPLPLDESVAWSVAMHRSLCALLGDHATPLATGIYPKGVAQPVNRLSIQVIPAPDGNSSFALLLPQVVAQSEASEIFDASRSLRRVFLKDSAARVTGIETLDPSSHWPLPGTGLRRLWRPSLGLVPDTRNAAGSRGWSFADSAHVAVGFLLRDQFDLRGPNRFRSLVQQVADAGVRVGQVHRIPDSRIARYAHKTPSGVTVTPYTAWFDLNTVIPNSALFALGQSRHLGGGLMHPVDVPAELVDDLVGAHEVE